MIVADTSGIIAAFNPREPEHEVCRAALLDEANQFVVSPLVLAEVDYLAGKYLGPRGAVQLMEVLVGFTAVAVVDNTDIRDATRIAETYLDMRLGLTDATNIVLAGRVKAARILSLDKHYLAVRPFGGISLSLIPG